jgi:hypothetical protein
VAKDLVKINEGKVNLLPVGATGINLKSPFKEKI